MARSVTGAPAGSLEMIRLQLRPLSLTISAPRKSAKRPAQGTTVEGGETR